MSITYVLYCFLSSTYTCIRVQLSICVFVFLCIQSVILLQWNYSVCVCTCMCVCMCTCLEIKFAIHCVLYSTVEYASREDMKNALRKLDGAELNGRKLKLTEDRGGGGGGGYSRYNKDRRYAHVP